jgi:hypothetical protein
MRFGRDGRQHLSYCLNIHAGEHWMENLDAIRVHAKAVRDHVSPDAPFGLGLRLSAMAAEELLVSGELNVLRRFLEDEGFYAFTINGFPYGAFHETTVKQNVYAPDWGAEARLTYTCRLVDILAKLLPEGVMGTISTVPGSYREWVTTDDDRRQIVSNLAACVKHMAATEAHTGRHVMLALEPEPDCMMDTTDDAIQFFNTTLQEHPDMSDIPDWRRYLGVCLDACHMAVQFEDPAESLARLCDADVPVPKVHISAALQAMGGDAAADSLAPFCEGTYLHQTRIRTPNGSLTCYPDLSDAALHAIRQDPDAEVRVHCHVPLYMAPEGLLESTSNTLSERFFSLIRERDIPHVEVETYTFNILPASIANRSVDESIATELQWALARLQGRNIHS